MELDLILREFLVPQQRKFTLLLYASHSASNHGVSPLRFAIIPFAVVAT